MPRQNNEAFKKLQAKWDKKLAKSGFADIESRETGLLKDWHNFAFKRNFNKTQFEATECYYNQASKFLCSYSFRDEFERELWRLHTEAIDVREIARILSDFIKRFPLFVSNKSFAWTGIKKSQVHRIIQRLREEMRLDS